jgi:myo-inositol 2-dehydrogenase/D-chiro-inositol 1-dehydrogenase
MLRIGLVGTGFIGSVHAANIARHPQTELVAIHDIDLGRAASIAKKTGASVVDNVGEIFESEKIDAVFITSSTNTHIDYLKRAARGKKAAYCEKPIGLDYQEAEEAVRVVRQAGILATIGFNRRFDPNHAALCEEVRSGGVGQIEIIQLTSRGPNPPPFEYLVVSGGQMRDQAIHFFDLLRWISDDEAEEIYAVGSALVNPKVAEVGDVDTAIVSIRMKRGELCQIDCSRRTNYGYDERIEVFGSKGLIESRRQRSRGVSRYLGDKVIEDGLHPGWFERVEESYYLALSAFVDAVIDQRIPSPSLEDGLKAQLLANKATESLKTGVPIRVQVG